MPYSYLSSSSKGHVSPTPPPLRYLSLLQGVCAPRPLRYALQLNHIYILHRKHQHSLIKHLQRLCPPPPMALLQGVCSGRPLWQLPWRGHITIRCSSSSSSSRTVASEAVVSVSSVTPPPPPLSPTNPPLYSPLCRACVQGDHYAQYGSCIGAADEYQKALQLRRGVV